MSFPLNLRQHGIIWTARLNNCTRNACSRPRKRLWSLIPSDLHCGLFRWSEAQISIWKAGSLPSCLSAHQLLTKNPHCNAPDARRPPSLRRLTRQRRSLWIFHIVRVIRFKTERRGVEWDGGRRAGADNQERTTKGAGRFGRSPSGGQIPSLKSHCLETMKPDPSNKSLISGDPTQRTQLDQNGPSLTRLSLGFLPAPSMLLSLWWSRLISPDREPGWTRAARSLAPAQPFLSFRVFSFFLLRTCCFPIRPRHALQPGVFSAVGRLGSARKIKKN